MGVFMYKLELVNSPIPSYGSNVDISHTFGFVNEFLFCLFCISFWIAFLDVFHQWFVRPFIPLLKRSFNMNPNKHIHCANVLFSVCQTKCLWSNILFFFLFRFVFRAVCLAYPHWMEICCVEIRLHVNWKRKIYVRQSGSKIYISFFIVAIWLYWIR